MAETIELGSLLVRLVSDGKAMISENKRATESLQGVDKAMAGAEAGVKLRAAAIAGAVIAAATAIAVMTKKMIDFADEMGDSAEKLQIPIEKLSALKYAAEQSDVSFEALSTGLRMLNKTLGEAAANGISDSALAFKSLGISVLDSSGHIRSNADVLNDLANRFAGYTDSVEKSNLAMAIFGRQGADLLPLLNRSASGIRTLTNDAARMGVVVGGPLSDASDKFNKTLARISDAVSAAGLIMAEKFLPVIQPIAGLLEGVAKPGGVFRDTMQAVADVFKFLSPAILDAIALISVLKTIIVETTLAAFNLITLDFSAMKGNWEHGLSDVLETARAFKKSAIELVGSGNDTLTGWDPTVGRTKTAAPIAKTRNSDEDEVERMRLESMGKAAQDALSDVLDDPSRAAIDKLAAIDEALAKGAISWHDYGRAGKKVAEEQAAALDALASITSQALSSIFKNNKTAAIASSMINTYQGITKCIATLQPPYSWAAAALTAAQGFAQVAAIRSTSETGGGGGGAAASISSGSAEAASASSGGGNSAQTLFVQGINASDFLDGNTVRGLAEKLLQFQRDGGKVVLV